MQEEECQRRDVIILIRRASSRPKNKPALSKVKKLLQEPGQMLRLTSYGKKYFYLAKLRTTSCV